MHVYSAATTIEHYTTLSFHRNRKHHYTIIVIINIVVIATITINIIINITDKMQLDSTSPTLSPTYSPTHIDIDEHMEGDDSLYDDLNNNVGIEQMGSNDQHDDQHDDDGGGDDDDLYGDLSLNKDEGDDSHHDSSIHGINAAGTTTTAQSSSLPSSSALAASLSSLLDTVAEYNPLLSTTNNYDINHNNYLMYGSKTNNSKLDAMLSECAPTSSSFELKIIPYQQQVRSASIN